MTGTEEDATDAEEDATDAEKVATGTEEVATGTEEVVTDAEEDTTDAEEDATDAEKVAESGLMKPLDLQIVPLSARVVGAPAVRHPCHEQSALGRGFGRQAKRTTSLPHRQTLDSTS